MGTRAWAGFLLAVDLAVWGLAWALRPSSLLLSFLVAWAALSLLVVTALYALAARGRNPGPVLKGARASWLQPVFFPYRVVAWALFALARLARRRTPAVSVVAPGLCVGARLFPGESHVLRGNNVRAIVDLAAELPTSAVYAAQPFVRLQAPALDRTAPTDDELLAIVEWALARRAAGDGVFIHCAFGRGRSALVTSAVVLAAGLADDPARAVALVAAARPLVHVRDDQFAALQRFHARWLERQRSAQATVAVSAAPDASTRSHAGPKTVSSP